MLHKEHGYNILARITESLGELVKVERPSRMSGLRMTLMLVPR